MVQLQIYATLIFYAVLVTICQQIAQALGEPLERIRGSRWRWCFAPSTTIAAHYSMARVTIWCRFWRNMPNSSGSLSDSVSL